MLEKVNSWITQHSSWHTNGNMPIKKTKKGYKITNTPGYSKTKKAAKARLRAIKFRQGKGRKKR